MNLLIDIGNSRIKWAPWVDGVLSPSRAEAYTPKELAGVLAGMAQETAVPERIIVSNVAGKKTGQLIEQWAIDHWRIKVEFVTAEMKAYGVINAYQHPERLGADRWAALLAVRQGITRATCIIDCGTTLTIDVLAKDGRHLGGLLVPGIEMMRRALVAGTKGIRLNRENPVEVSLLARDTEGAVYGGTLYAVVAVIDRVIADASEALRMDLACVVTGGNASDVMPLLACKCAHAPDLVLHGLARYLTEDT